MRYAIYKPPNPKDLAINQTMVAYGNRRNATAFARANNSDLLRSLKHLMGTSLYGQMLFLPQPVIGPGFEPTMCALPNTPRLLPVEFVNVDDVEGRNSVSFSTSQFQRTLKARSTQACKWQLVSSETGLHVSIVSKHAIRKWLVDEQDELPSSLPLTGLLSLCHITRCNVSYL